MASHALTSTAPSSPKVLAGTFLGKPSPPNEIRSGYPSPSRSPACSVLPVGALLGSSACGSTAAVTSLNQAPVGAPGILQMGGGGSRSAGGGAMSSVLELSPQPEASSAAAQARLWAANRRFIASPPAGN